MVRARFIFLLALGLTGCPPAGSGEKPVSECTKEGVSCTFATGKLGTCVAKPEPCVPGREACFMCQSQH